MTKRIELVVRLVRSKGVGVFFVTQNPLDSLGSIFGGGARQTLVARRAQ